MLRLKYFAPLAATVVLLSACGDQPLAPSSQAIKPHADVIIDSVVTNGSDMDVDFTVTSTGGWFLVGPHKLYFPANSICDPTVSTYGPTEWDQPCTVATEPVKIHASVRTGLNGQPMVEFTPSLRFAPSDSSWVYVFFFTDEAKQQMTEAEVQAKFNILWSPTLGLSVVDESVFDDTQKTYVIPQYGMVYRRIKHFSGYQVGSGFEIPMPDMSELVPGLFGLLGMLPIGP